MKKWLLCLGILLMPINIYAYSDKVILGGDTIGLEVNTPGVMVVGTYPINNKIPSNIGIGDRIIEVEGTNVNSIEELTKEIDKYADKGYVNIKLESKDYIYSTKLNIVLDNNIYKTGLYVKDSVSGIGTLTYIDPETKIYGALGHEIIETNSNTRLDVRDGKIFKSSITGIDRSMKGNPGGKNAHFYKDTIYGNITKNIDSGIYGTYSNKMDNSKLINIGNIDEIKLGKAYIYTVVDKENIDKYEINITKINKSSKNKAIVFEVTDKTLLEKTGGIVQGMSGSPIVQDDKLIGAVTHVVISSPNMGYGISIISMLNDGEKIENIQT